MGLPSIQRYRVINCMVKRPTIDKLYPEKKKKIVSTETKKNHVGQLQNWKQGSRILMVANAIIWVFPAD